MLIITGRNCAHLLMRRKILRLYWLAPSLCMNENRNHASRHARCDKKSEGIRTCPHFAITILYCVFRRSSYYHLLCRTVFIPDDVDASLRSVQSHTVDVVHALNLACTLFGIHRHYARRNVITLLGDAEDCRIAAALL